MKLKQMQFHLCSGFVFLESADEMSLFDCFNNYLSEEIYVKLLCQAFLFVL